MALHHGQPAVRLCAQIDLKFSCQMALACAITPGACRVTHLRDRDICVRGNVDAPPIPGQQTALQGPRHHICGPCRRRFGRQPVAREGLKVKNFQSRCRGAARKSRHDWRVETADNREHTGRGFCKCAVHRILLTSLAAPCHAAASSRGSCAVPAVWRAGASLELDLWNLEFGLGLSAIYFPHMFFPYEKKSGKCLRLTVYWSCAPGPLGSRCGRLPAQEHTLP